MRIGNSMQNVQSKSFKGVELTAFYPRADVNNGYYAEVDFTGEDRISAGKIFGLRPSLENDTLSVQMFLTSEFKDGESESIRTFSPEYDYADTKLKSVFRGYSTGRFPEGRTQFEQLCELMQKATASFKEHLSIPEFAQRKIRELFTLKK